MNLHTSTRQVTHRIALVGHCGPDSSYLRFAVASAAPNAAVIGADNQHLLNSALEEGLDLILLNRLLEPGYDERDGVSMIKRLKQSHPNVKLMLISNYADARAAAEAAGAMPGFGKSDIGSDEATEAIRNALGMVER